MILLGSTTQKKTTQVGGRGRREPKNAHHRLQALKSPGISCWMVAGRGGGAPLIGWVCKKGGEEEVFLKGPKRPDAG